MDPLFPYNFSSRRALFKCERKSLRIRLELQKPSTLLLGKHTHYHLIMQEHNCCHFMSLTGLHFQRHMLYF